MAEATLNGIIVNDGGFGCEYRFEYGSLPTALISSTSWRGSGLWRTGDSFSETITGLHAHTTYYFRAQARNVAGTGSGAILSFYTTSPPSPPAPSVADVLTMPATLITEHSARLNGVVANDGDFPGDIRFEWGVTRDYGNVTQWRGAFHSGDAVYEDIKDLAEGMGYHFRAQFRNREVTVSGRDLIFNTLTPLGPVTLIEDELLYLLEAV